MLVVKRFDSCNGVSIWNIFSIVIHLLATSGMMVFLVYVSGAQNFEITCHHLRRMNQDKLCQVLFWVSSDIVRFKFLLGTDVVPHHSLHTSMNHLGVREQDTQHETQDRTQPTNSNTYVHREDLYI
jgi:hypothetical protein